MIVPPRYTGTIWLITAVTAALLAVSGRMASDGQPRFGPTELLLWSGSWMLFGETVQSLSPGYQ